MASNSGRLIKFVELVSRPTTAPVRGFADAVLCTEFPTRGFWDINRADSMEADVLVDAAALRRRFNEIRPHHMHPQQRKTIKSLLILAWEAANAAIALDADLEWEDAPPDLEPAHLKIRTAMSMYEYMLENRGGTGMEHNIEEDRSPSPFEPDQPVVEEETVPLEPWPVRVKIEDPYLDAVEAHTNQKPLRIPISAAVKREDSPTPERLLSAPVVLAHEARRHNVAGLASGSCVHARAVDLRPTVSPSPRAAPSASAREGPLVDVPLAKKRRLPDSWTRVE